MAEGRAAAMPDEPSTTAALPFSCCSHCACPNGERIGHDDTCSHGCNDNGENDEAPGKVWVVVEQEMYEVGPVRIVGVFSSEESAERASAENDGDRSVYVVELEP